LVFKYETRASANGTDRVYTPIHSMFGDKLW